jgi:hypothetical protein
LAPIGKALARRIIATLNPFGAPLFSTPAGGGLIRLRHRSRPDCGYRRPATREARCGALWLLMADSLGDPDGPISRCLRPMLRARQMVSLSTEVKTFNAFIGGCGHSEDAAELTEGLRTDLEEKPLAAHASGRGDGQHRRSAARGKRGENAPCSWCRGAMPKHEWLSAPIATALPRPNAPSPAQGVRLPVSLRLANG